MSATMQTLLKPSNSPKKGRTFVSASLQDFVQEHFAKLAYVNKTGWLYVAKGTDRDSVVVKVGFSTKPHERVRLLSNASPFRNIEMLAIAPCRMVDEIGFHECMKAKRLNDVHREWYLPSIHIDNLIAHILETGSLPRELTLMGDSVATTLVAQRVARNAKAQLGNFLRKRMERKSTTQGV